MKVVDGGWAVGGQKCMLKMIWLILLEKRSLNTRGDGRTSMRHECAAERTHGNCLFIKYVSIPLFLSPMHFFLFAHKNKKKLKQEVFI
jgi:hypothetical protein